VLWGTLNLLPMLALQLALGIREWDLSYTHLLDKFLKTLMVACISGIMVAVVEEYLFRGALQGVMIRDGAPRAAIVLSSIVYAALHFVRSTPGHSGSPWGHGLQVLAHSFDQFVMPAQIVDSFAALLATGIMLALVRWRTGSLAMGIGMHAAWVALIKLAKQFTDPIKDAPFGALIGDYDGVTGWLAFIWLGAIAIGFWIYLEKNSPAPIRQPPSSVK
jgi:membrane protease YdiL (CAAX protease family)